MGAPKTGFRRFLPALGLIVLAVALNIFFALLHPAATFSDRLSAAADQFGGAIPSALLAAGHAAQLWSFDRNNLVSTLGDMLVSCWPVILVLIGAVLFRAAMAARTAMTTSSGGNS